MKKVFLRIIAVCTLALMLTGCFVTSGNVASIKILELPSTVFEQDDATTESKKLLVVEITDTAGETKTVQINYTVNDKKQVVLTYTDPNTGKEEGSQGIAIDGFGLSEVGIFTATVKYMDVYSYFDYEVVNSAKALFAGGNGSYNNPYQIASVEHFQNMDKIDTTGKYFEVIEDIDFSVADESAVKTHAESAAYVYDFAGIFDGKGKSLYNVTHGLFGNVHGGALKANGSADYELEAAPTAIIRNLEIIASERPFGCASGNVLFENIEVKGTMPGNDAGHSAFLGHPGWAYVGEGGIFRGNASNITLKACDMYVDMITKSTGVSVYCGTLRAFTGSYKMIDCNNYGNVEGLTVGLISLYEGGIINNLELEVTNCSNKGKMVQTSQTSTDVLFSRAANTTVDYSNEKINVEDITANIKKDIIRSAFKANDGNVTLNPEKLEADDYAGLYKDENNEYYIMKNPETTSDLKDKVAYFVVSVYVNVNTPGGTSTTAAVSRHYPVSEFVENKIMLGIHSNVEFKSTVEGEYGTGDYQGKAFVDGEDGWLRVSEEPKENGKYDLYFYSQNGSNSIHAPSYLRLSIFAYDTEGKLVAGMTDISVYTGA